MPSPSDSIDRRVDEAEVAFGVLVGEGDDPGPQGALALVPPCPLIM
jgi:hypothetical protein